MASTSPSSSSATLDLFPTPSTGPEEEVVLQGQLSSTTPPGGPRTPGSGDPGDFNTLDEPIKDTIWRDVRAVGHKFYHVLYPVEKKSLLKVRPSTWKPRVVRKKKEKTCRGMHKSSIGTSSVIKCTIMTCLCVP